MISAIQPILQNESILLRPIIETDFNALFAAAADPLIWQQHPEPTRYTKLVFEKYFNGAIDSKGALVFMNKQSGEIFGCSRYKDFNAEKKTVEIGFTFITRAYWGGMYNKMIKALMINHIFNYVDTVYLHIGKTNYRSQAGNKKMGAIRIEKPYPNHFFVNEHNLLFAIKKENWKL